VFDREFSNATGINGLPGQKLCCDDETLGMGSLMVVMTIRVGLVGIRIAT